MQATIDNISIYYDILGKGRPILFAHGFPLSGEMWKPVAEKLADRYRCIIPDLRGHGRSGVTPEASIPRHADDLAALLESIGEVRPVVLVGLSMGGMIAFDFFRRHRDRLRALVLCDTRVNAEPPEGVAKREAVAQAALKDGSKTAADAMIKSLFAPSAPAQLKARWHAIMSKTDPVGVAAAARALAGRPDSVPTLPLIDCPTLIIYGREDTLTAPSIGEEIQRGVAGSKLELIPNAGHMAPVEQPDLVAASLRRFLESLP